LAEEFNAFAELPAANVFPPAAAFSPTLFRNTELQMSGCKTGIFSGDHFTPFGLSRGYF
jgi:hypothetical protein